MRLDIPDGEYRLTPTPETVLGRPLRNGETVQLFIRRVRIEGGFIREEIE